MKMPCRITDENTYNPWEGEAIEEQFMKSLESITLYDLMGEDHSVWMGKNKDFGYILEIENDEGETVTEKCIHPNAAESLASFCRRYLSFYETLEAA